MAALTETSHTARRSQGSRRSRFTEQSMEEYTPADSTYEEELEEDVDDYDHQPSKLRISLRISNAVTHLTACVLLLYILAQFLARHKTWYQYMTPQAITLIVLLSVDICLDLQSVVRFRERWPGLAVLFRLLFGIGYLAVFMVYVAMGHVFTPGYSYWGLEPGYAGPIVYLFLWLIGVWNLLHAALHRHQVGHDIRQYVSSIRRHAGSDRHRSPRDQRRGAAQQENRQSRQRGQGPGWIRQPERSTRESDVDAGSRRATRSSGDSISLDERRAESKTSSVVSSSPRSEGGPDASQENGRHSPPGAELRA